MLKEQCDKKIKDEAQEKEGWENEITAEEKSEPDRNESLRRRQKLG